MHTEGEWFSRDNRVRVKTGRGTDTQEIAYVAPAVSEAERAANATLIAAAPAMLATLQTVAKAFRVYTHDDQSVLNAIRETIRKATNA